MSTFPAFLLGAQKRVLEPTQNLPRTLPEPPQEPLLNPSRASPNRRQSDSKPIPDRSQTDPNRVPNKEPKNGCQLGPHKFSFWRPSWPPCWRGSWHPLPVWMSFSDDVHPWTLRVARRGRSRWAAKIAPCKAYASNHRSAVLHHPNYSRETLASTLCSPHKCRSFFPHKGTNAPAQDVPNN